MPEIKKKRSDRSHEEIVEETKAKLNQPIEVYTPERKAQFLLSNAVNVDDYAGAVEAVRAMGLDPDAIPHYKPSAV